MDVGTPNNAVVVPDLLKVMEAAAVLRVGRTSAYEMAREYLATDGASGMPTVRIGGQLRIPRVPFEEWIGAPITVWPPLDPPTDDEDPCRRSTCRGRGIGPRATSIEVLVRVATTVQRLGPPMPSTTRITSRPSKDRQVPVGCEGWSSC